jgi:hypothetical protein
MTPAREMLASLGGNGGGQAVAAQPQQPAASRMAMQPRYEPARSYAGSAQSYSAPPAAESMTAAAPQTYHIGDDSGPADAGPQQHWNGSAWTTAMAGEPSIRTQPLPPVEE